MAEGLFISIMTVHEREREREREREGLGFKKKRGVEILLSIHVFSMENVREFQLMYCTREIVFKPLLVSFVNQS
jgi:hypothetical protein